MHLGLAVGSTLLVGGPLSISGCDRAPPALAPQIPSPATVRSDPALSALRAPAQPAVVRASSSPSAPISDEALLRLAAGECSPSPAGERSPLQALPCEDQRASALFELASRWTASAAGFAAPSPDALRRFAAASSEALHADSQHLQAWTLAGVAALAALRDDARHALAESPLPTQILTILADAPPLLHARGLFALGAMFSLLPGPTLPGQVHAQIAAGLRHPDRMVWRQAVLAAVVSGDDSQDPEVLRVLPRLFATDAAPSPAAAAGHLPILPARLSRAQVADLAPLLPPFVDELVAADAVAGPVQALRLLAVVLQADPQSGTAHFLRAKLLDRRHDAGALAELRTALALGNLPSGFVAELGPAASTLTPAIDLEQARRRVRALLAHRHPLRDSRRARLTASLLDHPGQGQPVVVAVAPRDLEARAAAQLDAEGPSSPASLALGRELFRTYPFSSQQDYDSCLRSFLKPDGNNHDLLDALGLQLASDDDGPPHVVGLVQTREATADAAAAGEAVRYGVTCALCHTQTDAQGQRRDGLPSRSYDPGLLLAACIDQPIHYKAQNRNLDQLMAYLPGRNDSSSDGVNDPTDIPSLWGLADHGAVRWNGDTPSLELQIDRNLSSRSAPPAVIALVAAYLRSLGRTAAATVASQTAAPTTDPLLAAGRRVFARTCARCHEPPLYTSGRVIALATVETDATRVSAVLPNSGEGYKVPTLLGLSQTAPYLHDGSQPSLEALLDPRRGGGHRFGQDLTTAERAALLRFLRTL